MPALSRSGHYHAHQHLAQEDLDFAVHLGDYIYEGAGDQRRSAVRTCRRTRSPRSTTTGSATRQYKSDPHLQAVHAAFPWIVTWDDHETENDYAGLAPENPADPADNQPDFPSRRARAYQAYYEHMPLRASQLPVGPDLQLYPATPLRRPASRSTCSTRASTGRTARRPTARSRTRDRRLLRRGTRSRAPIEGDAQQDWLVRGLRQSNAEWNLLANQVPFAPNDTNVDPAVRTLGGEKWDGYPFDRQRVLDVIAQQQAR